MPESFKALDGKSWNNEAHHLALRAAFLCRENLKQRGEHKDRCKFVGAQQHTAYGEIHAGDRQLEARGDKQFTGT